MSNITNDRIKENIAEDVENLSSTEIYDLMPKAEQGYVMEKCGNDKDKFEDAVMDIYVDWKFNQLEEA